MRRFVLTFLLSTVPLLAEPIAPVAHGPAYGSQSVLAIGTNDRGQAFVVWQDIRDGGYAQINGSRVGDEGELVDPFGIAVAPNTGFPWSVNVSADGEGWVVDYEVASERRRRHRVSASGVVSPATDVAPPAAFTHELLGSRNVIRASNGSETLIVGRRSVHEASQLVTFRLNEAGELLGAPVVFAPLAIYRGTFVDLLWTGDDWVLLFRTNRELRAQRIDRSGAPAGDVILVATNALYHSDSGPAATHEDGSVALVYRSSFDEIRVARIDGRTVTRSEAFRGERGVVAATAGGYVLAWDLGGGIAVSPMTRELALLDAETMEETLSRNAQKGFATDRSSEARLLVWSEEDGTHVGRLMARRPDSGGKFALYPSSLDQRAPAVARLGETHFVVWYERAETTLTVKGMLFDLFNEPLLPEPVWIGTAPLAGPPPLPNNATVYDQQAPAVVWSGHYFLVAWNNGVVLNLARVTAGGVVVHDEVSTGRPRLQQWRPVLVRAGSLVYLVFQSGDIEEDCIIFCHGGSPARIFALRFDLAGQRIDDQPLLVSEDERRLHSRPDAAWNGRTLLVTWISEGTLFARELDAYGNLYEERLIDDEATTGSVIAHGEELAIAVDAELWRDAAGVRTATERLIDGVPAIDLEGGRVVR